MAGELTLKATLNKPNLPVTTTQQLAYLLIEIEPTEVVAQVRVPLNFGFVLDHSGSMTGAKVEHLREAVRLAIDQMADQDLVSLVIFNDHSDTILESSTAADRNPAVGISRMNGSGRDATSPSTLAKSSASLVLFDVVELLFA